MKVKSKEKIFAELPKNYTIIGSSIFRDGKIITKIQNNLKKEVNAINFNKPILCDDGWYYFDFMLEEN